MTKDNVKDKFLYFFYWSSNIYKVRLLLDLLNKSMQKYILCLGFLGIGILTGWLIWSNSTTKELTSMHQMPNGQMMGNTTNTNMQMMVGNMTTGLQGKTGDEFDKEFLSEMIVHHEGAVDMAKLVLANSKRPELLKLANDIISAQTKEIDMMKEWQLNWFK
ncbi:MAG TPA: DUF305 domain-containing protein [Chitinophagales bacterium]|jgi:hypothetical protein|nr:DUF305 domain-containing protein [Chitinophagales bacterium]